MKKALLMSSSRMANLGYLEHASEQIHQLFNHQPIDIVFIPYAAVTFSFDEYENMVKPVFNELGYNITSIHRFADPVKAIKEAKAIAVGGGNTFALLKRMYDQKIVELIAKRVNEEGVPYIGWSAGSNVATPSLRTTNDMPIVQPPSFKSFKIAPFQINPHFISGKPAGHNGESREDRLNEFLTINPDEDVLALHEGTALYIEDQSGTILGHKNALWFDAPNSVKEIQVNKPFPLSQLRGAKNEF